MSLNGVPEWWTELDELPFDLLVQSLESLPNPLTSENSFDSSEFTPLDFSYPSTPAPTSTPISSPPPFSPRPQRELVILPSKLTINLAAIPKLEPTPPPPPPITPTPSFPVVTMPTILYSKNQAFSSSASFPKSTTTMNNLSPSIPMTNLKRPRPWTQGWSVKEKASPEPSSIEGASIYTLIQTGVVQIGDQVEFMWNHQRYHGIIDAAGNIFSAGNLYPTPLAWTSSIQGGNAKRTTSTSITLVRLNKKLVQVCEGNETPILRKKRPKRESSPPFVMRGGREEPDQLPYTLPSPSPQ